MNDLFTLTSRTCFFPLYDHQKQNQLPYHNLVFLWHSWTSYVSKIHPLPRTLLLSGEWFLHFSIQIRNTILSIQAFSWTTQTKEFGNSVSLVHSCDILPFSFLLKDVNGGNFSPNIVTPNQTKKRAEFPLVQTLIVFQPSFC